MAILNDDQIKLLVKQNEKVKQWVVDARNNHKDLNALVNGVNYKDLLLKLENIEKNSEKAEARKKYAKSIKALNERLLRLIDNVYSATGGSKNYALKGQALKDLIKKLSKIRDNKSLEKWLEDVWKINGYIVDPNGVLMLEWKDDKCWPTYKSIDIIRCYESRGQNLEWLLFEPIDVEKKFQIFRFVDDEKDILIKKEGEKIDILEEEIFFHEFGETPAIVNSNIQEINSELRKSPIHNIVDIEHEYLRDQSILTLDKNLNGIMVPWRYRMECGTCKGTGKTGLKESCKMCNGKGHVISGQDVTDEIWLPLPKGGPNDVKIAPDIGGYITPPLEIWNQYREELKVLELIMFESLWGTHMTTQENTTATAKLIDTQPVINRLNSYSDVAQFMEKQLTEWIINFQDINKDKSAQATTILYGRGYIIEPPDVLLEKYNKAKSENAPITVLDRSLSEYITSKFKHDPEGLMIHLKKKDLEYYVHNTLKETLDVFGKIAAQKKMMFNDWWEQLEKREKLNTDVEKLKEQRDEWMKEQLTLRKEFMEDFMPNELTPGQPLPQTNGQEQEV